MLERIYNSSNSTIGKDLTEKTTLITIVYALQKPLLLSDNEETLLSNYRKLSKTEIFTENSDNVNSDNVDAKKKILDNLHKLIQEVLSNNDNSAINKMLTNIKTIINEALNN